MKATINNFMGCAHADIEASPIALIVGRNHQGKSSTLRPIQCALTGETIPLGLKKADAGLMVKLGSGGANIELTHDGGSATINWPKAELRTTGDNPPQATPIAAGLTSIIEMTDKQRVEFLRGLLNCLPAKADLVDALSAKGITPTVIDRLWDKIDQDGWEATHKHTGDKGRDFKAQWNYITKETYGSKKADVWLPDGWDDSLAGSSKDALESQVAQAKAELEYCIAQHAVSDDTRERLAKDAENLAGHRAELAKLKGTLEKINEEYEEFLKKTVGIPSVPERTDHCPHCGAVIGITKELLLVDADISEESKKAALAAMKAANKTSDEYEKRMQDTIEAVRRLEAKVESGFKSAAELEKLSPGTDNSDETNAKREAVRKAEQRKSAFNDYTEATRLHNNVLKNQIILDALDENGVRRTAMERGLSAFNERLSAICKECGWAAVAIDRDLTITLNGRPYVLLSASEQYRVRVTLQLAIADIDRSDAVVIDAAELLDKSGRAGLLRALAKRKQSAFVGMMANEPKVPNLKKMGSGNAYWIENGDCTEVENG